MGHVKHMNESARVIERERSIARVFDCVCLCVCVCVCVCVFVKERGADRKRKVVHMNREGSCHAYE